MEDTIAAISTAYGEGGIGIVRMSGEDAESIFLDVFDASGDVLPENRKLTYGKIREDDGKEIDEVLAVIMKAPYTYTREDVVEIDCHGSVVSLKKILDLLIKKGARLAEPGEFTKRAFLNGRLDLSQAEAVMDIVKAKTEKTYDVAVGQLSGLLSKEIKDIRKELMRPLLYLWT